MQPKSKDLVDEFDLIDDGPWLGISNLSLILKITIFGNTTEKFD